MVTIGGLNNTHGADGVVHHKIVESGDHLTIGEPAEVAALVFRTRVGRVGFGQLGKQFFVLGVALQLGQQFVGFSLGGFLADGVLAVVSALEGDQDMAGHQGIGAVLHINDTNQVESTLALVRAIHITNAIAILEDGLLDGFRDIVLAHPSAVVTLIGVGVDEVDHVISG